jgi:preprotein translocase subunit SecB
VDVIGAFSCDGIEGDEDKKQVHAQCYDQLFPYMQTVIQNLMQASGIPGFQLRKAVINPENVRVGSAPAAEEQPAEPSQPRFPIV